MNLKSIILACAFVAAQLHAATPEVAMNAARVPEADVVFNISVAKISKTEFGKHALLFYEKARARIGIEDEFEEFYALLKAFQAENITLDNLKKMEFSFFSRQYEEQEAKRGALYERLWKAPDDEKEAIRKEIDEIRNQIDLPSLVFGFQFEKSLTLEAIRKLASQFFDLVSGGYLSPSFEPVENGVAWDDDELRLVLGDNRVVFFGPRPVVEAAQARSAAGTRAAESVELKALLSEKLTQRDAYLAVVAGKDVREAFNNLIFWEMDLEKDSVAGTQMKNAIEALQGFTVALDCSDTMQVSIEYKFPEQKYATFVKDFISVMAIGGIKTGLFQLTGTTLPFMDTLKVSAEGATVTFSGAFNAKDLEMLYSAFEKTIDEF